MDKFSSLRTAAMAALIVTAPAQALNADVPGVSPEDRSFQFQLMQDPDGVANTGDEVYFSPEWIQDTAQQQILDVRRALEAGDREEAQRIANIRIIPVSDLTAAVITQEEFFEAAADLWDEGHAVQRYAVVVDKDFQRFTPDQINRASDDFMQRYLAQQDQIIQRAENILSEVINRGFDTDREQPGREVESLALSYGFGGTTQLFAVEYDPNATRLLNDGVTEVPVQIGDVIIKINDHSVGFNTNTNQYHNILSAEGIEGFVNQLRVDAETGLHTMSRDELAHQRRMAENGYAQNDAPPTGGVAALDP